MTNNLRRGRKFYCAFVRGGLLSTLVLNTEHAPENQYDSFVKKIDRSSQACHLLMSGVFERQTKSDHFERVMKIMCTDSEAAMLLDVANRIYPDIAPDIARYIAGAIEP